MASWNGVPAEVRQEILEHYPTTLLDTKAVNLFQYECQIACLTTISNRINQDLPSVLKCDRYRLLQDFPKTHLRHNNIRDRAQVLLTNSGIDYASLVKSTPTSVNKLRLASELEFDRAYDNFDTVLRQLEHDFDELKTEQWHIKAMYKMLGDWMSE